LIFLASDPILDPTVTQSDSNHSAALMSAADVAHGLGVSEQSVRQWADAGQLDCVVLPNGARRFTAEAVNDLVGRLPASAGAPMTVLEELREAIRHELPVSDSDLLVGAAKMLEQQDRTIAALERENGELRRRLGAGA
jgi:DNA-binding transcriptional MerR regulator